MMLRIREKIFEIKLEAKLFLKFLFIVSVFLIFGIGLISYNIYYMKIENEITKTTQNILQLEERILNLKKEKAQLISPENVERKAKKDLDMKEVNLDNVKFLTN